MEGIITVLSKKGHIYYGRIWEVICLLRFGKTHLLMTDIKELSIDGNVIPKPKTMQD